MSTNSLLLEDTIQSIVLFGIIFASMLPVSLLLDSTAGGFAVILMYGLLLFAILYKYSTLKIRSPKYVFIFLLLITIGFSQALIRGQFESITNIGAAATMITVVSINLTIIPYYFSRDLFIRIVIAFSVMLSIVGLAINFGYHVGVVTPEFIWRDSVQIPLASSSTPYLMSITQNPNTLGAILSVGLVFSVFKYVNGRLNIYLGITTLLAGCLYLTQSRASLMVVVIALAVFFSVRSLDYRPRLVAVSALVGLVMLFFVPIYLRIWIGMPIDLSKRVPLWIAAIRAVSEGWILGFGFGSTAGIIEEHVISELTGYSVHNSYLRMFLIGGVVTGISYIMFIIISLVRFVGDDIMGLAIFSVTIGVIFRQLFEAGTIIGYTSSSILSSLLFGYMIMTSNNS
ncbi:O-antigen ligase family protein [Halorubrum sp. FL23]|uniref:O-antigen ligase family protein n=1 Tax=Halorubrum sp. FL23 TaxID=3458704 RepID=UPI004033946F